MLLSCCQWWPHGRDWCSSDSIFSTHGGVALSGGGGLDGCVIELWSMVVVGVPLV